MIRLIQIITLSLLLAFTFAKPTPPGFDISTQEVKDPQRQRQTPGGVGPPWVTIGSKGKEKGK
ncbi:hypothetical protein CROQUDRAFT_726607 [Cronartium quercuum f. sp. fusiforme G11]|uniref:Secreted protein n=1 Tax=Cronartium quercuum f. sp. fusiforme G11 TaxID=708437 RepID=A0A9P6N8E1_9BASI|nr:hypothetical protein CROQUDRAFT_726607 [Cronartium quercuum f. sp. fusiforme G11]